MADFFEKRGDSVWESEKEWKALVSTRRIISIPPKSSENEGEDECCRLTKGLTCDDCKLERNLSQRLHEIGKLSHTSD